MFPSPLHVSVDAHLTFDQMLSPKANRITLTSCIHSIPSLEQPFRRGLHPTPQQQQQQQQQTQTCMRLNPEHQQPRLQNQQRLRNVRHHQHQPHHQVIHSQPDHLEHHASHADHQAPKLRSLTTTTMKSTMTRTKLATRLTSTNPSLWMFMRPSHHAMQASCSRLSLLSAVQLLIAPLRPHWYVWQNEAKSKGEK